MLADIPKVIYYCPLSNRKFPDDERNKLDLERTVKTTRKGIFSNSNDVTMLTKNNKGDIHNETKILSNRNMAHHN
jgi:hypothetical protein